MKDEILEEIYEIRRRIAEECNYDFQKIGEYFMRWQEQHPENLVREVPRTEEEKPAVTKN